MNVCHIIYQPTIIYMYVLSSSAQALPKLKVCFKAVCLNFKEFCITENTKIISNCMSMILIVSVHKTLLLFSSVNKELTYVRQTKYKSLFKNSIFLTSIYYYFKHNKIIKRTPHRAFMIFLNKWKIMPHLGNFVLYF